MNTTATTPARKFELGSDAYVQRISELEALLVPDNQRPLNGYSELFRVTLKLWHILGTEVYSFGKLPYEAYILRRKRVEIEKYLSNPEALRMVYEVLTADVPPNVSELRQYVSIFEDVLCAVVNYADECVVAREQIGENPAAPVLMAGAGANEYLVTHEYHLSNLHLNGRHAGNLEGEVFRAAKHVAQVIDTTGMYGADDLTYSLTLLSKFEQELTINLEVPSNVSNLMSELLYRHSQKTPIPVVNWRYDDMLVQMCRAAIRMSGFKDVEYLRKAYNR